MNYTQLTNSIKSYTENSFPDSVAASDVTSVDQTDTFIRQAEQRVYNTIQLLELRKNVTGTTTAGNKYLPVPCDWLSNFSLAAVDPLTGEYEYLLNKDVNFIRESFPFPTVTGKPTHYALFDRGSYILGPTPDAEYELELHYFHYPPSIVDAGTSWLGDNFDSVLLYGSLLEAYTYMKGEEEVIGMYQKRYDDAVVMLKQLGEGKNRQDMYRSPQVRYDVR